MDKKERIALEAYGKGCTCSQAVIQAFQEELGLDEKTLCRLTEGFGSGFGCQEVCGAFAAATMVISYLNSDGNTTGETKHDTYNKVLNARKDYLDAFGSIRCIEIMHGEKPRPLGCGQKVKEAVDLVLKYIENNK